MKILAISTGKKTRYIKGCSPNAILVIVQSLLKEHPEIEITIIDQSMGKPLPLQKPDAMLISTGSISYKSAIQLCEYAKQNSVPVLMGGPHFDTSSEWIAKKAAELREVIVCYGDGEITVNKFIDYLRGDCKLDDIPNVFYTKEGSTFRTKELRSPLGSYSTLPVEIFDPRPYWDEADDGYRKIVGPRISVGCLYKTKSKCSYCSWSSKYRIGTAPSFWEATKAQINWALSIPWTGKKEVRAYQIGADLGSDKKFVKDLWNCRPSWASSVIRHRIYSHAVSDETAPKLYDNGMRYIFIGADGKPGYTYEWNSPLVTNLETCRKCGLIVGIGFVIGKRGEKWQDLSKWKSFRDKLVKEFKGTIVACYGWINLVMPGSSDWDLMTSEFPEIKNSDYQDLLELREKFLYKYTFLKSLNIVEKLEKIAKEFDYNG